MARSPKYTVQQLKAVTDHANAYRDHECGIHDLTYKSFKAGCPLCEATRTIEQLRYSMQEMRNRIGLLEDENHKLKDQVDLIYAIRTAMDLLDASDTAFLKAVLYQWRDEKSLALKATHGGNSTRRDAVANGFIVIPRHQDPYGHTCSSVGGMAIAEYFDEAMKTGGPHFAMGTLSRGLAPLLPGSA